MLRTAKKSLSILVCIMSALFICAASFPTAKLSDSDYEKIGFEFKQKIAEMPYFTEITAEELSEFEEKLSTMDFRFAIPENYKTGVDGVQLDMANVYFAPINQYENRAKWISYSVPERVRLSQIPEEKIKFMTTDELLISCLNYNLLIDMAFADTTAGGYEALKKEFNALPALIERPDLGSRLLVLYRMIDLYDLMDRDRSSILRLSLIESLLSEKRVIKSLTDSEVKELVNVCSRKMEQILNTKGAPVSYTGSVYTILRCLYQRDSSVKRLIDQEENLKSYINGSSSLNIFDVEDEVLGRIYLHIVQNYLQ